VKAKVGAARTLETLLKEKSHQAVIEYLFTGSRYKIRIPRHNVLVILSLSGVQAPQLKQGPEPDSPAVRALEFAKARILQRNVRIELEASDKYDNLIGNVFLSGKENFSSALLAEGLARLVGPPDRNKYHQEMKAIEDQAKAAKLGLWVDFVEGVAEAEADADVDGADLETDDVEAKGFTRPREGKEINLRVTDITDASNFYCHLINDPGIVAVESSMKSFVDDPSGEFGEESLPRTGALVAGRFSDGNWYRVKIEGKTGDQYRAYFIDYGNRELLDLSSLRVLDPEMTSIPPLAHSCVLSAVKGPGELSEYYDTAGRAFSSVVWDKDLVARVDLIDAGRLYLTVRDPDDPEETVNRKLLRAGWARVQEKRVPFRLQEMAAKDLRPAELEAKRAHRGVWEHGNVSDEDETAADDAGRVPLKRDQPKPATAKGKEKEKDSAKPKDSGAAKGKKEEPAKAEEKGKPKGKDKGKA